MRIFRFGRLCSDALWHTKQQKSHSGGFDSCILRLRLVSRSERVGGLWGLPAVRTASLLIYRRFERMPKSIFHGPQWQDAFTIVHDLMLFWAIYVSLCCADKAKEILFLIHVRCHRDYMPCCMLLVTYVFLACWKSVVGVLLPQRSQSGPYK